MKTKRDRCWDDISLEIIGDEFELDALIAAQPVKDFDSPVFSFVVSENSEIVAPKSLEVIELLFKAPWE